MTPEELNRIFLILLIVFLASVVVGSLLLVLAYRRLKKIDIPPGAGYSETLRLTPLSVVVAIDLLDLGLDFLSAPISWVILDRLGLNALRQVAAIEALIPGTQLLPTLTLSWLAARLLPRIQR